MRVGQWRKTKLISAEAVVERGNVRFLYRPKIDEQDASSLQQESLDDVQRFYMVLARMAAPSSACW